MANAIITQKGAATTGKKEAAKGLQQLADTYRLSNQVEGKSIKTVTWYHEMLQAFIRYLESRHIAASLPAFNIDTVRNYILYLQQKHRFQGHATIAAKASVLSPRTVQCHVQVLRAFSSWLLREGYTTANRLQNLKLPKAPHLIIEPLTPEEIEIIMQIATDSRMGERNRTIIMLALDSGLRAGEIAGIRLGQVNLQAGLVKVMGKGSKERIVPIGKVVQAALWHYINRVRPATADSGLDNLFLNSSGQPLTVNGIKLLFSGLAERSGIRRLHAHLCRHTFATSYLTNGGDIFSLRGILGHTTFEMVNNYLHLTTAQITEQHHKYSPMDRLQGK